MKAVGGIGCGVFEISEDLVGYEWLCFLQYDDPDLFRDLYIKIGDLLAGLWKDLLPRYGDLFCVLPHAANKPFLLHSCGKIFEVMDDIIATGVNAKHSNEDQIALFYERIDRYGSSIGFFGGFDLNDLCCKKPDVLFEEVVERGTCYRAKARGFALGSGNSIPNYVPVESFLAMVKAAEEIRWRERSC